MQLRRATTFLAALPFVAGLWFTPLVSAHEERYAYGREGWYSHHSHGPNSPYWGKRRELSRRHAEQHEKLEWKYGKTMRRLDRQEQEARAKAYRHYRGRTFDWRYRERVAEIDRNYDLKRSKVAQQLERQHERAHQKLSRERYNHRSPRW